MVADKFTEVTLRNLFPFLSAFQLCFGGFVIFIKCYQTSNLIGRGSFRLGKYFFLSGLIL